MILAFDTETTGLYDRRLSDADDRQPHIVQLAMILAEDDGTERATVNLMVEPDGWIVPADVAAIHGISTDVASRCGVPEAQAVALFDRMAKRADKLVAHNIDFDLGVMRVADLRTLHLRRAVEGTLGLPFCTMKAASPIIALPPTPKMIAAGFLKNKPPNLGECIRHFFGEELTGAHDAMVDVRACLRVYLHLMKSQGETPAIAQAPAQ